jgi:hypothetical protein
MSEFKRGTDDRCPNAAFRSYSGLEALAAGSKRKALFFGSDIKLTDPLHFLLCNSSWTNTVFCSWFLARLDMFAQLLPILLTVPVDFTACNH